MTFRRLALIVAVVVVAATFADRTARISTAAAADNDLVIDVPDAVKAAVRAEAAGDKIVELRRDNEGGNAGFLVVASGKSGEYLMRFDTAGLLTRKWVDMENDPGEKAVTYEQLPKPVRETLADQLRGGTATTIMLREIKPTYEVRAKIGPKFYDIRLDTAGKLLEKSLSNDQGDAAPH